MNEYDQELENRREKMLRRLSEISIRFALILMGAAIVSLALALKSADWELASGAAVEFGFAAIFAAFGSWIGGDDDA